VGVGLWDNETITPEWDQARSVLRIGDEEYERIMAVLTDSVSKSDEFISIIK
jgi:hypothetical protein